MQDGASSELKSSNLQLVFEDTVGSDTEEEIHDHVTDLQIKENKESRLSFISAADLDKLLQAVENIAGNVRSFQHSSLTGLYAGENLSIETDYLDTCFRVVRKIEENAFSTKHPLTTEPRNSSMSNTQASSIDSGVGLLSRNLTSQEYLSAKDLFKKHQKRRHLAMGPSMMNEERISVLQQLVDELLIENDKMRGQEKVLQLEISSLRYIILSDRFCCLENCVCLHDLFVSKLTLIVHTHTHAHSHQLAKVEQGRERAMYNSRRLEVQCSHLERKQSR